MAMTYDKNLYKIIFRINQLVLSAHYDLDSVLLICIENFHPP